MLLTETPPIFGRSICFFHILHRNCLLFLSPFCFAVCGHHISPRIAIVFSLLSSLPNSSMSHTSNFLISSNASRSSLKFHILLLCESYSLLCHMGTYLWPRLPPPDYWYISFFFLLGPGPLDEIVMFQLFRVVHWAVQISFHSNIFPQPPPPYIS